MQCGRRVSLGTLSLAIQILGMVGGLPLLVGSSRSWVTRLRPLLLLFLRDTTCLDIRYPFRIQRRHLQQDTARHGLGRSHELGIRIRGYQYIEEIERHLAGSREAYCYIVSGEEIIRW